MHREVREKSPETIKEIQEAFRRAGEDIGKKNFEFMVFTSRHDEGDKSAVCEIHAAMSASSAEHLAVQILREMDMMTMLLVISKAREEQAKGSPSKFPPLWKTHRHGPNGECLIDDEPEANEDAGVLNLVKAGARPDRIV
jgi:hypothetical protein